jgi:hypothetical protein
VQSVESVVAFLERTAARTSDVDRVVLVHRDGKDEDTIQDWMVDPAEWGAQARELAAAIHETARGHAVTIGTTRVSFSVRCMRKDTSAPPPSMALRVDDLDVGIGVADGGNPKAGTKEELMLQLMTHLQVKERLQVGGELRMQRMYEGIIRTYEKRIEALEKELTEIYKLLRTASDSAAGLTPEAQAKVAAIERVTKDVTDLAIPALMLWAEKKLGVDVTGGGPTDTGSGTQEPPPGH